MSSQNLQESITRIVTLESTIQPILNKEYTTIIQAIQPLASSYGTPIVTADIANGYIIHKYNNRLKHFSKEKLDDINYQFASLKKVSYDGIKIEFLPTFYDWVYEMVHQQHNFLINNPADKLMTERLFPELIEFIQGALDSIESHTNHYANQVRLELTNIKHSLS